MKPVPRPELEYLRRHIREAIADERMVCLACGAQMRNLGGGATIDTVTFQHGRHRQRHDGDRRFPA